MDDYKNVGRPSVRISPRRRGVNPGRRTKVIIIKQNKLTQFVKAIKYQAQTLGRIKELKSSHRNVLNMLEVNRESEAVSGDLTQASGKYSQFLKGLTCFRNNDISNHLKEN